jgi:predicted RNA-binding Zn-ribbon protein involved in translation (DUF1610 family)
MGAEDNKRKEIEEQIRKNALELNDAIVKDTVKIANSKKVFLQNTGATFKLPQDTRPPRLYNPHICPICQTKRMLPVQRFLGSEEDYSVMFSHYNPEKQMAVKKAYDFFECPKCGLCLWFRSDAERVSNKDVSEIRPD